MSPHADRVFVSVIVPTFRDWRALDECLGNLRRQTCPSGIYEIVVVNNDPTDPCPSYIQLPENCRLLAEPDPGSYSARNTGAREAVGNILSFTDSDCRPAPDWVERIVKQYEHAACGCLLSGAVEMYSEYRRPLTALNFAEAYDFAFGINQELYAKKGHAATANLSMPKYVFEDMGGFDSALFSGGDTEFCRRAATRGYPLVFCRSVKVYHPLRSELQGIRTKARRIVGGKVERHGIKKCWYVALPPLVRLKILADKDMPAGAKLKAGILLIYVKSVQVLELLKIALRHSRGERN